MTEKQISRAATAAELKTIQSQVNSLATRVAQQIKAERTAIEETANMWFTAGIDIKSGADVNMTDITHPENVYPTVNDLIVDANGDIYSVTAIKTADDTGIPTVVTVGAAQAVNLKGAAGTNGTDGAPGANGQSAYEIWKAQAGNADKTEADFLASLRGERGETGAAGKNFEIAKTYATIDAMNADFSNADIAEGSFVIISSANGADDPDNAKVYVKGAEAYTFVSDLSGAQGIQGPAGKDGAAGTPGTPGAAGESAYALWLKQSGNAGKSEADFLASLKGAPGESGAAQIDDTAAAADKSYSSQKTEQLVNDVKALLGDVENFDPVAVFNAELNKA